MSPFVRVSQEIKMAKKQRKGNEKIRGKMMEMVKRGHKTLKAASLELRVSYRQAKRIYQRYLSGAGGALTRGNKGKPSNHRTGKDLIQQALLLCEERYYDFGPAFAQEKMLEREGLNIGVSTLRRELIKAGLWKPNRNSNECRPRREPRKRFGELVRFDGGRRGRFEGKRKRRCLIALIDGAARSRIPPFFEEETLFWGYGRAKNAAGSLRNTGTAVLRQEKRVRFNARTCRRRAYCRRCKTKKPFWQSVRPPGNRSNCR
jgi:hypothetical protein